jgi:hypothetical protein
VYRCVVLVSVSSSSPYASSSPYNSVPVSVSRSIGSMGVSANIISLPQPDQSCYLKKKTTVLIRFHKAKNLTQTLVHCYKAKNLTQTLVHCYKAKNLTQTLVHCYKAKNLTQTLVHCYKEKNLTQTCTNVCVKLFAL